MKSVWQNPTHICEKKILFKLGVKGSFLNMIKVIYEKVTVNIILSGERLKAYLLRTRTRQGCLLAPCLSIIVLEVLTREIKKEREKKGIQIGKEKKKKNCLCLQMAWFYMQKTLNNPPKILLELINEFSKVSRYIISTQKSVVFLCTINEQSGRKLRKQFHL